MIGWLPLESAMLGDGWRSMANMDSLGAIVFATRFGHVWDARIVLANALACIALCKRPRRSLIIAVKSGCLLGSLGLTGHAAMHEGWLGWVHRCSDMIHALSAGAWLGSLLPLFPLLRAVREPANRIEAALALHTFSNAGHVAVAAVLMSGVINTWLTLGLWPVSLAIALSGDARAQDCTQRRHGHARHQQSILLGPENAE